MVPDIENAPSDEFATTHVKVAGIGVAVGRGHSAHPQRAVDQRDVHLVFKSREGKLQISKK